MTRFGWPGPDEIVDEFWRRCGRPTQRELDTLTKIMGIPPLALARAADGGDFPIAMFRVLRSRRTFEFGDDEALRPSLGFVAWDRDGFAHDLVAWNPRDGWSGTWLGRAALLNEHEIQESRIDGPLPVFLNIADWLRAHRHGVVILDEAKAARLLEGLTVHAIDVEEGITLRKILERPRARIVVPAAPAHEVAA